MVIIPIFTLDQSIRCYLSASKFHSKGKAARVTRCGGLLGLQEKAAQAARAPLVPDTGHSLEGCNFIIFTWPMAEFKEEVAAC